jgi:membrane protein
MKSAAIAKRGLQFPFRPREAARLLAQASSEFFSHGILNVAAAITFYILLALFPAITAFVSLYGLVADVHDAQRHLVWLHGILPRHGLDIIGQDMLRLAEMPARKTGLAFFASLIVSLWSANAGAGALIEGLNRAYDVSETRGYFAVTLRAFGFTLAALLLSAALFACAALPVFARAYPRDIAETIDVLRWVGLIALSFGGLVATYVYAPSGRRSDWRAAVPGALVAIVLWIPLSALYSVYVNDIANYDRIYGSLGTAIGFLMWIWLSMMVVLFGAELNAVMDQGPAEAARQG